MTKRAKKVSTIANHDSRLTLRDVPPTHYARLASGIVRVAAVINGRQFVRHVDADLRCTDAPLTGPFEMDGETPALEVITPRATYTDRGEVKDPVAA